MLGKTPAKASNSSKIRVQAQQKRTPKNCLTSPLESIKNTSTRQITRQYLSLASLRHHLGKWPWENACEGLEQQQDSSPRQAKTQTEKLLNVTFGIHKKQFSQAKYSQITRRSDIISANGLGKTPAKASNSSRIQVHAKQKRRPKNCSTVVGLAPTSSRQIALGKRLRRPRTAAGFKSTPSKNADRKTA